MKAIVFSLVFAAALFSGQAAKPLSPTPVPAPSQPTLAKTKELVEADKVAYMKLRAKALEARMTTQDLQIKYLQAIVDETQTNAKITAEMQELTKKSNCVRIALVSEDNPVPVCVLPDK